MSEVRNKSSILEASDPVRVAAFDCGTNSLRLKIAAVDEQGMHTIVPRRLHVIRLGEQVDQTHRFTQAALERLRLACTDFQTILAEYEVDAKRFIATSASRDVENREEFRAIIEQVLGVTPEVIPGTEEARLSFLAATHFISHNSAISYEENERVAVIDLGGGSTELVVGSHTAPDQMFSMDIGSVRMTERYFHHDPPTDEEINAAIADIDARIQEAFEHVNVETIQRIIGVSGTVTTMAALCLGLKEYDHRAVDGTELAINRIVSTNDKFLRMPIQERREYKTIHPGRIDVVGGGALVLSRLLLAIRERVYQSTGRSIDTMISSEHGLLDGIILDTARNIAL